jgi:hypothetical protein
LEDQREQTRAQLRHLNLWATANGFKREADLERATVAKANGMEAKDIPGFMQEVPFGNVTTIHQVAPSATPPSTGIAKWVAVVLAAGAIGFGSSFLLNPPIPPKPETPPPVNAVIEWEIVPDDTQSGSSSIRTGESRFLGEASENIGNRIIGEFAE